ncbi:hypothetical protein BpHYR1_029897 [Brachionus plicatilis]|uniref:RNA-directed DNA polymerase from mobile element jockey-like n=1 Tax=Brachionus plicatilis TaxID=10195 RepID=A0A3M7RQ01_BRAPC|nr:hypothetical protein BpHYR1_029897 [Brachionus plicatilis]
MHFRANNMRYDYQLGGLTLNKTTKERDLGIIVTSDLKSSEQAKRAAARATMLASDGLDSPAGNTRTVYKAIERQLIRNCGVRHNFFTNRTAGNWNTLNELSKNNLFKKLAVGCYSGASTCATTWRLKTYYYYY